uniref:Alpha/beta hydrolase n=1 Tax=Roseihalotalea indica TaxID=2867963 RepID=A0AA49JJI5_9BACT|nr:alpha/beta hydrolase [Tunicatimonas sp. TK19036]
MTVYFISGLGADERAFRYIKLPGVEKRFIRWIPPKPKEPLRQYAHRLIDQIDTSQPVTLVGLSFGGIVAQVIAELIPCAQLILISSIKNPRELSPALRFVKKAHIYRALPLKWLKPIAIRLAPYWFDAVSDRQKGLLRNIINDTDEVFAQWAIGATLQWRGSHTSAPTVHLHGTHDRVFPVHYLQNYIPVKGGGHFMIVTHARILNPILQHHLTLITS